MGRRSVLECYLSLEDWSSCKIITHPNAIEAQIDIMNVKFKGSKSIIDSLYNLYKNKEIDGFFDDWAFDVFRYETVIKGKVSFDSKYNGLSDIFEDLHRISLKLNVDMVLYFDFIEHRKSWSFLKLIKEDITYAQYSYEIGNQRYQGVVEREVLEDNLKKLKSNIYNNFNRVKTEKDINILLDCAFYRFGEEYFRVIGKYCKDYNIILKGAKHIFNMSEISNEEKAIIKCLNKKCKFYFNKDISCGKMGIFFIT